MKSLVKIALVAIATLSLFFAGDVILPHSAAAYPFWAQQNYENPREATGRIVCANCHLAAKPVEVEVPQAVLPDSVFKAVVKIPYDTNVQQVVATGEKGGLNVGAVLMLPPVLRLLLTIGFLKTSKRKLGLATYSSLTATIRKTLC